MEDYGLQRQKTLIVVRTYPVPARRGIEVSCTAGLTETGVWLRLFPISYRFLTEDKRFRKYQWIEVMAVCPRGDSRPESRRIDEESITILSEPLPTKNTWAARKQFVETVRSPSLCDLKARRDADGEPTLGLFRPKTIERLEITSEGAEWTVDQLEKLRQHTLFEQTPTKELKRFPIGLSTTLGVMTTDVSMDMP